MLAVREKSSPSSAATVVGSNAGLLLAALPVLSFVLQYAFSIADGTQRFLFHHLTVMVVDWIFVPFNYVVVRTIDWQKGGRIFAIAGLSVCANALTHAYWQYHGLDLGHMITAAGVVLPAGWVHLAFSSIEMMLLAAFVFCRRPESSTRLATGLATFYFVVMAGCGYVMHHAVIASDFVVFVSGLFFVLLYPRLSSSVGKPDNRL